MSRTEQSIETESTGEVARAWREWVQGFFWVDKMDKIWFKNQIAVMAAKPWE